MARKKKVDVEELESVLSGIAHEIRNPLNSLNMNTQLLSEYTELLPEWFPKKREMQEIIFSNINVLSRLNDLVSEFLRFTRPPRPEFVMADLNELVRDVISFVEADFTGKGIKIKQDMGEGPFPVLVDGTMVKQALLNILLNSAESMDKDEKIISITTGEKGDDIFVSVVDNGCGIGRDERKKIFTLFHTSKQDGSGLGLPIVKKVMREHSGRVGLRSRKGRGSEFLLYFLPAARFREVMEKRAGGKYLPEVIR